jgi:hypothetical protein
VRREDPSYFDRVAFLPEADRVDRWFQVPDGRSVSEVCFLIDECTSRYGLARPELVIDPLCGTGSAAVAAALRGLSFEGYERDPLRALYAAAKCAGLGSKRPSGQRFLDALQSVQRHGATSGASDLPEWTMAVAAALAASDDTLLHPGSNVAYIVAADLDERSAAPSSALFRAQWRDIADVGSESPDHRPAVVITSPPHPRSRAAFVPPNDESVAVARTEMRRLGAANPMDTTASSFDHRNLFTFLSRCHPGAHVAFVEFETVDEYGPTEDRVVSASRDFGWSCLEIVDTYVAAPDEADRGRGGYVVLTSR